MAAMRAVARWQIGDDYWADRLMWAYNNPDEANDYLKRERDV